MSTTEDPWCPNIKGQVANTDDCLCGTASCDAGEACLLEFNVCRGSPMTVSSGNPQSNSDLLNVKSGKPDDSNSDCKALLSHKECRFVDHGNAGFTLSGFGGYTTSSPRGCSIEGTQISWHDTDTVDCSTNSNCLCWGTTIPKLEDHVDCSNAACTCGITASCNTKCFADGTCEPAPATQPAVGSFTHHFITSDDCVQQLTEGQCKSVADAAGAQFETLMSYADPQLNQQNIKPPGCTSITLGGTTTYYYNPNSFSTVGCGQQSDACYCEGDPPVLLTTLITSGKCSTALTEQECRDVATQQGQSMQIMGSYYGNDHIHGCLETGADWWGVTWNQNNVGSLSQWKHCASPDADVAQNFPDYGCYCRA